MLAAAAVLVAVQQWAGVNIVIRAPGVAHDGGFATCALAYFHDLLSHGVLPPRWVPQANGGLGSPIFMYYPPGAYLFASLALWLWPGLSPAGVIVAGCAVFRAGSLLAAAFWLRRHTTWPAALAGGALYALMPYVAFTNPQMRLAFAETAAGMLVPLVFLAVDVGGGRLRRTVLAVAPAIAALALTHLPMTVLGGGLAMAYAACSASRINDAIRCVSATLAGILVGLAMAGVNLVPALLLADASQMEVMRVGDFAPEASFLFTSVSELLEDTEDSRWWLIMHAAIVLPAAAGLAAWLWTPSTPAGRGVVLTLVLACFLLTPVSVLVWRHAPFLRLVQFPFRLALPISLFGAVLLALAVPTMTRRWRASLAGGATACALLLATAALDNPEDRPSATITAIAMQLGSANTPEYLPAAANGDWPHLRLVGPDALRAAGDARSGCVDQHGLPARHVGDTVTVELLGCSGDVALPQFFYPGWVAAGLPAPVADPATGLVRVTVPPGTADVTLYRTRLPQETLGIWVSLAGVMAWIGCALGGRVRAGAPHPVPPHPAMPSSVQGPGVAG